MVYNKDLIGPAISNSPLYRISGAEFTYLNGRPPVKVGHHHDGGACDEDAEGDAVVELEGAVVDERLLLLEVATEVADLAEHDLGCSRSPLISGRRPSSTLW